jgi:hypothetical protein
MIVEYIRSKIPKEETRAFGQPIQAHKLHCRLLLIVLAIFVLGTNCLAAPKRLNTTCFASSGTRAKVTSRVSAKALNLASSLGT